MKKEMYCRECGIQIRTKYGRMQDQCPQCNAQFRPDLIGILCSGILALPLLGVEFIIFRAVISNDNILWLVMVFSVIFIMRLTESVLRRYGFFGYSGIEYR